MPSVKQYPSGIKGSIFPRQVWTYLDCSYCRDFWESKGQERESGQQDYTPFPHLTHLVNKPQGKSRLRINSLHLVEVVGASVVNVMAEGSSDHGQGLQVCKVTLQLPCLEGQAEGSSIFSCGAGSRLSTGMGGCRAWKCRPDLSPVSGSIEFAENWKASGRDAMQGQMSDSPAQGAIEPLFQPKGQQDLYFSLHSGARGFWEVVEKL